LEFLLKSCGESSRRTKHKANVVPEIPRLTPGFFFFKINLLCIGVDLPMNIGLPILASQ
jgi:hypothetical protein